MVEIEIGERLMQFLTAWIIPIIYTELRLRRHANHQSEDIAELRAAIEELKKQK